MELEEMETNGTRTAEGRAPRTRPRRLRARASLRELAAETRLHRADLIMPHFVVDEVGRSTGDDRFPALDRVTPETLLDRIASDVDHGLTSHLLFGVPDRKDRQGSASWDPQGPVPRALRLLRDALGTRVNLLTDVCLCSYTDHGHCGVLGDHGDVDNDATLPLLARAALAHAEAGADLVCPSDMMDGRVAVIRDALDEAGHTGTGILSYSTKFASTCYGPFRLAADSAPAAGDRRGYQLDPRNLREAVREALLDEAEGADALMVKPALAYLDVIRAVQEATRLPLACYQVSGEYALTRLGAREGLFDEAEAVREQWTAMKRAGADWIISYHSRDAAREDWIA